jgi:hypothetical protein
MHLSDQEEKTVDLQLIWTIVGETRESTRRFVRQEGYQTTAWVADAPPKAAPEAAPAPAPAPASG